MVDDNGRERTAEYASSVSGLHELGTLVVNLVSSALTAANVQYHSIDFRIKEAKSAFRKINQKSDRYQDIKSLTDLLGVRIITYFEDEVDSVAKLLEREFNIDTDNSVDKRSKLDPDRFGYLSLHYILTLSDARSALVEYSRFANFRFEVQIRTVLQHAWAEIEHDLGYKATSALPAHMRRRFSRIAGLLEVADAEFRALRDEIQDYGREVQEKMGVSPQDLRIDQTTLYEFALTNELAKELDLKVAELYGFDSVEPPSPASIAKYARALELVAIDNIDILQRSLNGSRSQILRFASAWRDTPRNDSPNPGPLKPSAPPPAGISITYFANSIIADYPPEVRNNIGKLLDIKDPSKWADHIRRVYDIASKRENSQHRRGQHNKAEKSRTTP